MHVQTAQPHSLKADWRCNFHLAASQPACMLMFAPPASFCCLLFFPCASAHPTSTPAVACLQTIMAQQQAFFDSTTKGDIVSRLTLDVQVLQATVAGGLHR